MRDRRDELRDPTNDPITLSWTDPDDSPQSCVGTLQDVSKSGARVLLPRPVRIKTVVRLTIDGAQMQAAVMSCVRGPDGYMLGIEFDAESQGVLKRLA